MVHYSNSGNMARDWRVGEGVHWLGCGRTVWYLLSLKARSRVGIMAGDSVFVSWWRYVQWKSYYSAAHTTLTTVGPASQPNTLCLHISLCIRTVLMLLLEKSSPYKTDTNLYAPFIKRLMGRNCIFSQKDSPKPTFFCSKGNNALLHASSQWIYDSPLFISLKKKCL